MDVRVRVPGDLTAGQLREWLKELGLPTAGRKAVLIARLQAEDNDDDIRSTTAAGDDEPVDEVRDGAGRRAAAHP